MKKQTYAAAGVDFDAARRVKELIKRQAQATVGPQVIAGVGPFAGLFELKGYREPVLVSSVDGVGTKLKIASALGKHDTIGIDLVNHCVNDILTSGAEPLFFLDYIAMGKLVPQQVEAVVKGMAEACRAVGCALIGGETAEMPGFYPEGDYDLVGFIIGVVEKGNVIDGRSIKAGDAIIGLASSGLHTNGYSLVRKLFGTEPSILSQFYPELGRTLGEELLEPHRCYYHVLKPLLFRIKGMAHITGGGLIDNLPRILPPGLGAGLEKSSWGAPPIFALIQKKGNIDEKEMYRVFNMGIGMALVSSPDDADQLLASLPGARVIGGVVEGGGTERVIIT
jgi:phosphoribosylformylglycinamidine cyclo-ligase